jgi:hypothetical protein
VPVGILILMKASARAIAAAVTVTLPVHVLLILSGAAAALILLVFTGIALPAVWSAKPARRKAAADLLRQVLNARTGGTRQVNASPSPSMANKRSIN